MTTGRADRAGSCALVGAGEFGATFAAQVRRIPSLRLDVICDRDVERALRVARANRDAGDVVSCDSRAAALAAIEAGKLVVVADPELLRDLPLKMVVEATGDPRFAAMLMTLAQDSGYNTTLATKEAESVVGPILARRAKARGLVHTPVEGDQPSLLIGLVNRARALGLPVVTAGKAGESDYVYDPAQRSLTAWGRTVELHDEAAFRLLDGDVSRLAARVHPQLETSTPPDLCEMGVVANHTGLMPDTPGLHFPVAHTTELPSIFRPRSEGGLLEKSGIVDGFICMRRPDELSFAGGVFVVVEAPDQATGRLLASKGIPGSPDGRYLLLHNPVHLLGVEAPISVMAALGEGRSTGGPDVAPHTDLVAVAKRDFAVGERFELGARHTLPDIEARLQPAAALGMDSPVPYYLSVGAEVVRAVKAGAMVTGGDLAIDQQNPLLTLRREQDAAFFGA
ncbi:hypothetical protein ASE63_16825 [Bosea sp. Root381]|uniref:hypothetical protein n=1 Tax=Bosea sp. Root381 TaxID=1736524 RepID=UPI0006F39BC4|nr:hypothetical protein [Bosea sp. Root381]KRE15881.1 hypothetical protein ASE63_16825 [Bosea sp. Root381]